MSQIRVSAQLQPQHSDWSAMRQAWVDAEELGVDCLFNWDHFYPLRGEPEGKHFECLTVLGAMAEVTERVELGSLVICNAYRNPDYLADAHRTIDQISGGRAILGIGAGWFEKDFDEYGYDFGTVGTRLTCWRRRCRASRRAWASSTRRPCAQPMPILIGGGGPKRTLKLVAQYGNIWHSFGSPDVVREKSEILRGHCADVGRDPAEIEISWGAQNGDWDELARRRRDALHPRRLRQRLRLRPRPPARARAVEGRAVIVDESTEFGARVAAHLRDEIVVWMTVVAPKSGPLPMPVWFLWEGGESVRDVQPGGARVRNLEANPLVSLNFAGDGRGGDIVVLRGRATRRARRPKTPEVGAYVQKYAEHIERIGHTPESFGDTTRCRCGSS